MRRHPITPINPDASEAGTLGWYQWYEGGSYIVSSVCHIGTPDRGAACYSTFDQALLRDPDIRVTLLDFYGADTVTLTGPQFLQHLWDDYVQPDVPRPAGIVSRR